MKSLFSLGLFVYWEREREAVRRRKKKYISGVCVCVLNLCWPGLLTRRCHPIWSLNSLPPFGSFSSNKYKRRREGREKKTNGREKKCLNLSIRTPKRRRRRSFLGGLHACDMYTEGAIFCVNKHGPWDEKKKSFPYKHANTLFFPSLSQSRTFHIMKISFKKKKVGCQLRHGPGCMARLMNVHAPARAPLPDLSSWEAAS